MINSEGACIGAACNARGFTGRVTRSAAQSTACCREAADEVSQLVVSYPVELDNVQVLFAQASGTVKVPALVPHVNWKFHCKSNQKRSPE